MKFRGFGQAKGRWKSRVYLADGTVLEDAPAPQKKKSPSVHTRFRPFISPQVERKTARKLGLKRVGWGTAFSSERELDRYLAHEKHHGRDVGWKDY